VIVVIGDSISAGQHLDPPDVPWPVLLTGERTINASVPGDTTRHALLRFPRDVQAHEPEVVVIQFGHNDANRWETDRGLHRVSPQSFAANLHEMVSRAKHFRAVPYLCTLTPSVKSVQHQLDCKEYDKIVREVAKRRGVPLIDVAEPFTWVDKGYSLADLLVDGLHLSGWGHRLFAETAMRVLG